MSVVESISRMIGGPEFSLITFYIHCVKNTESQFGHHVASNSCYFVRNGHHLTVWSMMLSLALFQLSKLQLVHTKKSMQFCVMSLLCSYPASIQRPLPPEQCFWGPTRMDKDHRAQPCLPRPPRCSGAVLCLHTETGTSRLVHATLQPDNVIEHCESKLCRLHFVSWMQMFPWPSEAAPSCRWCWPGGSLSSAKSDPAEVSEPMGHAHGEGSEDQPSAAPVIHWANPSHHTFPGPEPSPPGLHLGLVPV